MRVIFTALLMILSVNAVAINTEGYETIEEIKAWGSSVDVYLSSGQVHQCSGGHETRFVALSSNQQQVSFLLAAFMGGKRVNLAYSCNSEGIPIIAGVRIR